MTSRVDGGRWAHAAVVGTATFGGALLRAATGVITTIRPAAKPLHPVGQVWTADVLRHGATDAHSGVPWLDDSAIEPALVRLSAAIGLPRGWPDFQGIALRTFSNPGGVEGASDVLFATTGAGRFSRFVLTPARSSRHRRHTTLLPYQGPRGPLLLAAEPVAEDLIDLFWAELAGPWVRFATVALRTPSTLEPTFDPVLHCPPGLRIYPWVAHLREPAYSRARGSRGER